MAQKPTQHRGIRLIESDEEQPRVALEPGKRFEVVTTTVVDTDLKEVAEGARRPSAKPPRMCGSRSTCVALVEIPTEVE